MANRYTLQTRLIGPHGEILAEIDEQLPADAISVEPPEPHTIPTPTFRASAINSAGWMLSGRIVTFLIQHGWKVQIAPPLNVSVDDHVDA